MNTNRLCMAGLICGMFVLAAFVFGGCQEGTGPKSADNSDIKPTSASNGNVSASAVIDTQQQPQQTSADRAILDQVAETWDATLCEKLSTPDLQTECKLQVMAVLAAEQANLQTQQEREKETRLLNEIMGSGDIEKCKEVSDDKRYGCEINILLNKAVNKNDPKICEQASEKTTVEKCRARYLEIQGGNGI